MITKLASFERNVSLSVQITTHGATHAQILLTSLTTDKVEDDAIRELSIFAGLKRELVLRPEDDPEGAAQKSARKRTTRGRSDTSPPPDGKGGAKPKGRAKPSRKGK